MTYVKQSFWNMFLGRPFWILTDMAGENYLTRSGEFRPRAGTIPDRTAVCFSTVHDADMCCCLLASLNVHVQPAEMRFSVA